MLFHTRQVEAITREMTITVRAWRRPQAVAGRRYRLRGEHGIEVTAVDRVPLADVTEGDARRSGHASRDALVADLARALARAGTDAPEQPEVYRIAFRYLAELPDERARLARDDALDDDAFAALRRRLATADRRAADAWTLSTLRAIAERPRTRAADLAAGFGMETLPFKARVRRLKHAGLTVSHAIGYELSPRGRAYLARLDAGGAAARDGAG